jgi:hypothetical protein
VLDVRADRAVRVHRQLDVIPLAGMRVDARQRGRQVVAPRRVQIGAATCRILTDGDAVGGQRASTRRGDPLECDGGCQVAGFIPVEIDLEGAADMRLVVRVVVEGAPSTLTVPLFPGGLAKDVGPKARSSAARPRVTTSCLDFFDIPAPMCPGSVVPGSGNDALPRQPRPLVFGG